MDTIPLDYATLRLIWWLLLGILLIGFAVMDGFDLGVATLLLSLLAAADSALSVWQRLQDLPAWMRGAYLVLLAVLSAGAGWGVWRLLRPATPRTPRAARIDRAAVEARIRDVKVGPDGAIYAVTEERGGGESQILRIAKAG